MGRLLDRFSRLVTARPWITVLVLIALTFALAAGATRRAPPTEGNSVEFLPPDSPIAVTLAGLDEFFGESSDVSLVTLVFRGEALSPGGLAQMDALLGSIAGDPNVAPLLVPVNPVLAPSYLVEATGLDAAAVTSADIDAVRAVGDIGAALDALTGSDTDGAPVAIANIQLQDTDDDRVWDAERIIADLAARSDGPLSVSTVSPIIVEDEYKHATESGMAPLIGLALLLIAGLILLFMRSLSDLLLTLAGLILSVTWIVGAEGWMGPNALGWIGPPSSVSTMVPIIVISLTVDYAIQAVSHYRELRLDGEPVLGAVRRGLHNVGIPIVLAAVTTMASFLSMLFSPIGVINDFGIVAALGVALSLLVMLSVVPAGRTIIDRRREARGKLKDPRPVSGALPGIERAAEMLGAAVARRPAPYLIAVLTITAGFGVAATGLQSSFSIRSVLPDGGTVVRDLETLDSAVGGSTEQARMLLRAEATETRTLLNLRDLSDAFADEQRRPQSVAGPMEATYESLARDWIHDGGPDDPKYDAELAALFEEASAGVQLDPRLMQEFLDRLGAADPELATVLVNNPDGPDVMLLRFPILNDASELTALLQTEIEALWAGDDAAITAVGESILALAVTDQITDGQTESISTTVAVALGILAIFFWVTLRRPTLSVIAVGPIVLVLVWVLGTMALLGIPYSLITSIITALSIGIGVDYTIHVIHRYREEFSRVRKPEVAAVRTLATTGSALLGSALTTAFGFGVLALSPIDASRQFGITAAITIAYSLLVSVLVVPPAMTVWGAYENMRLRSTVQRLWDDIDAVAEEVYERHGEQDAPTP